MQQQVGTAELNRTGWPGSVALHVWPRRSGTSVAAAPRAFGVATQRAAGACHMPTGGQREEAVPVLDSLSKAAFACLWCFILVLPWDVYAELPVVGSIPRLVGIVASAVGGLYILARGRLRPLSWFHVLAILFLLWAGASTFWSIDPEATQTRFLTYLQLVLLVWLIWEIGWSPVRQRALLQAFVLGAGVAALITVYNYLTDTWWYTEGRFSALGQNPNYVARMCVLGLPMAWYLGLSRRHGRLARTWQLYIPFGCIATVLTGSRGAFLAGLVAVVIIPWTLGHLRLRTKAALYAFAIGSLVLASSFVPETSWERIRSTGADIETGYFGGRGKIWRAGLEAAWEHPLVGVGAGAFGAAVEPALQFAWASHDAPLAILVEDGIVGLCLFLAMVAAATKPLWHLPPLERKLWIVLLAALGVGSLAAASDYQKDFWFVLGLLAAQVAPRAGSSREQSPSSIAAPGTFSRRNDAPIRVTRGSRPTVRSGGDESSAGSARTG
jgi:O-antigen ligase